MSIHAIYYLDDQALMCRVIEYNIISSLSREPGKV